LYSYYFIALLILFSHTVRGFENDPLDEIIQRMIGTVSIENIEYHIETLAEAGGHKSRVTFTPGKDSAAVYIMQTFTAMPYLTSVEYDTFYISGAQYPYNQKALVNITATIEGTTYPEKCIVIGAHYDTSADREGSTIWRQTWSTIKAPGADDNATGVAALLDMARIMSDPEFGFSSKYTLKFVAFAAEERGVVFDGNHHGSRVFAQTARMHNEDIIGMISIDMVGYNNDYDYTAIVSNEKSTWLGNELISANHTFTIGLFMNAPPFPEARYSDHDNFWDEGYSAILVIENAPPWQDSNYYKRNPYYHTSSDTFEKVNMDLVKKVTQVNMAAVASMSGVLTSLVDDAVSSIPEIVVLYQNYPNPFNATTNIQYSIPNTSIVKIKVYDILGKEVAVLMNEEKQPGMHTAVFDASNLPSGVYYYRVTVSEFNETRRLLLIK
jgi:hypothetical protein